MVVQETPTEMTEMPGPPETPPVMTETPTVIPPSPPKAKTHIEGNPGIVVSLPPPPTRRCEHPCNCCVGIFCCDDACTDPRGCPSFCGTCASITVCCPPVCIYCTTCSFVCGIGYCTTCCCCCNCCSNDRDVGVNILKCVGYAYAYCCIGIIPCCIPRDAYDYMINKWNK